MLNRHLGGKMKTSIYAIFDVQTKLYSQPYFAVTDELMKRSFKGACLNTETDYYKYPKDYSLFKIGTYDPETSILIHCQPELIANATEWNSEKVHE